MSNQKPKWGDWPRPEHLFRGQKTEEEAKSDLTMHHFLKTVEAHSVSAREVLLCEGFHEKVVYGKALKAAAKGYTDYGVSADRPWLTDKGREFLEVSA